MKTCKYPHLCYTLRALATDAAGEINVLGHDSDAFGVDSTEVDVFEKNNQIRLECFLQYHHRVAVEAAIELELVNDHVLHTANKGRATNKKVGRVLVLANLAKGNRAWAEALDLGHRGGGLAKHLLASVRGPLVVDGLSILGFDRVLLGACHR